MTNAKAWGSFVLVSILISYFIYSAGAAYYAGLTAQYNSQGNAAWAQRSLTVSERK